MLRHGLKQVRNRRHDAVAQVRWDRLEALLAEYYTAEGYQVEHVGTGGTGKRFDGGIDLKLRRDDQYLLVQCKGWNAYQVPHNEVHQLIGLMVNEMATGAILVTTGEFTCAAIEAAARGGHVQLVDGADLRQMLGPLAEEAASPTDTAGRNSGGYGSAASATGRIAAGVGERLLAATEDRIRYGGGRRRGGMGKAVVYGLGFKLVLAAVSTFCLLLVFVFAVSSIKSSITSLQSAGKREAVEPATPMARAVDPASRSASPPASDPHYAPAPRRQPTEAEIRESQRKADEAMKVIEATTPEV